MGSSGIEAVEGVLDYLILAMLMRGCRKSACNNLKRSNKMPRKVFITGTGAHKELYFYF